jgi:small subunit ribosomal protein S21
MLIVNVKKDIEKALKQYKRKVFRTKQARKINSKRYFTKKSVERRTEIGKAQYVEKMYGNKNND